VNEVIAAEKDVHAFVQNVEHGARAFYAPPERDKTDAVGWLEENAIRADTKDMPTAELSKLARENRSVALAWMRSPLPLDGQRRELIESAWRQHVDASDPRRAESIAIGQRGAKWAQETLRTVARTLAGDLKVEGADIVAQLPAHDIDAFGRVFDLPRGEKRLCARLPRVVDAA
jgi:hypothetical protein